MLKTNKAVVADQDTTVAKVRLLEEKLKAEEQRLVTLQLDKKKVEDQLDQIILTAHQTTNDRLHAAARNLLAGIPSNLADIDRIEQKKQEIHNSRKVIVAAIELQRIEIESARRSFGMGLREMMRPEYVETVRATIRAAIALSRLIAKEREIREEFTRRTLLSSASLGKPGIFTGPGEFSNRNSKITHYLREMVSYEYITQDELADLLKSQ